MSGIRDNSAFQNIFKTVAAQLRNREFKPAKELICQMISMDPGAPEPHNLLGIFLEMRGDFDEAKKHYRAACALDPQYRPAARNLERLVFYDWDIQKYSYDFGDVPVELPEKKNKKIAVL